MTVSPGKIRVLNVLGLLDKGGAETLVLTLIGKHDRENFDLAVCGLLQPHRSSLLSSFQNMDIACYDLNIPGWSNYQKHPLEAAKKIIVMVKEFKKVCREYHPDIIHCHLLWPTILANFLFSRSGIGLVSTFHSTRITGSKLKRLVARWSLRYTKPVCIACSEAVRQASVSSGMVPEGLCITIPNGVDTDKFDPRIVGLPADNPFDERPRVLHVLQVGNLEAWKGHEYTIRALKILKDKDIPIFVCCAGTGTQRQHLEMLARQANVSENIRFLGIREDVKQLLKTADVFIMPSLREGLSIAMLEAMAMEVPAIASSVGGAGEVIEDGTSGFLIRPQDAESLAERIAMLANNAEMRKTIGENARRRVVEEYSLQKQASALEKVYRQIVKERRTGKRR